jgi:hypothetical protein
MIEEKNLDPEAADRIGNFVRMSGGVPLVDTLLASELVIHFRPKKCFIKMILFGFRTFENNSHLALKLVIIKKYK